MDLIVAFCVLVSAKTVLVLMLIFVAEWWECVWGWAGLLGGTELLPRWCGAGGRMKPGQVPELGQGLFHTMWHHAKGHNSVDSWLEYAPYCTPKGLLWCNTAAAQHYTAIHSLSPLYLKPEALLELPLPTFVVCFRRISDIIIALQGLLPKYGYIKCFKWISFHRMQCSH